MLVLVLISLILLSIGHYTQWLSPIRSYINVFSTPFYWVTNLPSKTVEWFDEYIVSRETLIKKNRQLRKKLLIQQTKLQKMAALYSENIRLRELMNSSKLLQDEVLIAELMGISPDPKVHKVIINKGVLDKVYVGQAVLDAFGLMGQVVSVTYNTAEVLFITDNAHAIPVYINRNGVRTVVEGVGDLYSLRLSYVPNTMDIVAGDLLVSSGLGGRFPAGYPVARVDSVNYDPGQPFSTVYAKPTAQLNRSRHVLLVFREGHVGLGTTQ
ncbi:rod shape-determining protein MreC [Candidatus Endobugula sertula]|uniref:Cell shape-determining protein MreC n=1 Tax=Candidatus Endobugula sertula TaxID=62101 RepID=A0A1D2QQP1_9GAMM|nr:rod shape-determining protein MreC [Candidatus Endobugula sertula]